MNYQDFDVVTTNERADRVAAWLTHAGIRFEQRVVNEPGRRTVYVIAVHPDDAHRAEELRAEATRRENEDFVRTLRFVRKAYIDKDCLETREPNEAGYHGSGIYHGEPFDEAKFQLVRGGWDHEHCYLCAAKVMQGDEWWAIHPPQYADEIGLCLDCYARLFDSDSGAPIEGTNR